MSSDRSRERAASTTPFRFKEPDPTGAEDDGDAASRRKRRRHRHHHRSHRRSKRHKNGEVPEDRDETIRPDFSPGLDPDQAFRESLFDALGDDEGANFWEGVYGQPIHKYPNQYIDEETGELETLNDEEYAQYVRRKMWEKSREGVEAAQEERRRERAKQKVEEESERAKARRERTTAGDHTGPHNNFVFDFEIEASLRRGQQRKDQKRWRERWKEYLDRWNVLQDLARSRNANGNNDDDDGDEDLFFRNQIAWPVESGKRKDVNVDEIEHFVTLGCGAEHSDEKAKAEALSAALKVERVRWHPDKIQQRYGFMQIDEHTMNGVTATFQIFDRLWNEVRDAKK